MCYLCAVGVGCSSPPTGQVKDLVHLPRLLYRIVQYAIDRTYRSWYSTVSEINWMCGRCPLAGVVIGWLFG